MIHLGENIFLLEMSSLDFGLGFVVQVIHISFHFLYYPISGNCNLYDGYSPGEASKAWELFGSRSQCVGVHRPQAASSQGAVTLGPTGFEADTGSIPDPLQGPQAACSSRTRGMPGKSDCRWCPWRLDVHAPPLRE